MSLTVIKFCGCSGTPATEYQDKTYGKGNRVCNKVISKGDKAEYRCTVCGKIK